ncbi:DUF1801 domain-containing protein [Cryobacterium sp. 1639]|uniref:DUF1801 domain-containing protein n=1 Tax=Cryobacterium inferilacus TaxID=2866629 RepID=UPI001C72B933|nr:DUF1801 domain-containing protein [Cryobacterium sp. 1639]MBX0301259.1 DUF1801 domain-containing protein [Cryobacterium sp. 1639]
MAAPKTRPTDQDVTAFLDAVESPRRREEGHRLREIMERVTQQPAVMWGPTMVGFGSTPHTNTLGTNNWFDVGFSPRKGAMTIYGVHNAGEPDNPLLAELGPHTTGASCLYVKRLDDIDLALLERLISDAWKAAHS